MALNQWLRRSLTAFAAALAITGLLTSGSLSQDANGEEDVPPGAAQTLTITITSDENGQTSSLKVGLAKLFDGRLEGRKLAILDRRLKDVFAIEGAIPDGPVLLVDDVVDSGWTLTVIAALLRRAGSGPVWPVALTTASIGT